MDFALTEEQEMLRGAARDFLMTECPTSVVREMEKDERGYPPQLYENMAALGWMGLHFPPNYGGEGGSFLDLMILLEEMGRACLPGAYFSSSVLGGIALLEGGSEKQRQRFLPQIAQGKAIFTVALTETGAAYTADAIQVKAVADDMGYIVEGRKMFVPDAHVADYIICVCRTGSDEQDITSFIISGKDERIHLAPLITMAGDKQFEVVFDKVTVPRSSMLGKLNRGWPIIQKVLQKATVAKCAEMIGGAQKVLEMTVDYAKQRVQFGVPIGTFEVVQHYCADMLMDLEGARFLTYLAGWMLSEGLPCALEVSAAKAWVNEGYERITFQAARIHGGVGFILAHDLPLYFKRAKQAEPIFGNSDFHREIVAQQLGL